MTERTGRCLCGAVKFKATPKVEKDGMHVDACHCGMCRRQVGGPMMAVNLESAPEIEDDSQVGVHQSSDWAERVFCRNCGSNLFYQLKDGSVYTVNAGALDDLSDARLATEIFIDDKPAFYDFAQQTRKMTGQEVIEMFSGGQGDDNG